jgi:hypothetical protein
MGRNAASQPRTICTDYKSDEVGKFGLWVEVCLQPDNLRG